MHVLVIADEPLCDVVCDVLLDNGLEVDAGNSYSSIVERLQKHQYRLIVVQGGVITEEQISSIHTLAENAMVCTFMQIDDVESLPKDPLLRSLVSLQIETLIAKHCVN